MKRKNLRGGRAASSTKRSHPSPTVNAIPLLNEDDAAVPRTSIESDHDLPYVREVGSKGNLDNDMNEGSTRSPQDSLGYDYICVDLLDRKICMSCNEGGEVLSCAERDCPVTFHAKCFCTEPKFDDRGNFYCPYCWYKRALAEAQEFRKKALLAKKDLVNFFRQKVVASDKLEQKDGKTKRNKLKDEVGNGNNIDHCNGRGNDSVESQPSKTAGDQQKETERATISANQDGVAVEDEVHENPQVVNTGDSRHCGEEKKPVHIELVQNNISKTHETRSVKKNGIVTNAKPLSAFRYGEYTDGHLPDIAFSKETQDVEVYVDNKGSVKDREKLVQNELRSSLQGCSKNLILQSGKRKRLNWTTEEENVLKEGVLRFAMGSRNIPWKKILEFGCHVFDSKRTPADLKDKWKNMRV